MAGLEAAFNAAQQVQRDRESAQANIFGDLLGEGGGNGGVSEPPLPAVERWSERERLAREKEVLGFFISGHPLDAFRDELSLFDGCNSANLRAFRDQKIELACVVTEAARQISKKDGSEWGRITVEDFYGTATVLAFGESWQRCKDVLQPDAPVLIRGQVSGRERDEESPPVFLDGAAPLTQVRTSGEIGVQIELSSHGPDALALQRAKQAIAAHPGPAPLVVVWTNGGGAAADAPRLKSRSLRVLPDDALLRELREALGEERVRLVRA